MHEQGDVKHLSLPGRRESGTVCAEKHCERPEQDFEINGIKKGAAAV